VRISKGLRIAVGAVAVLVTSPSSRAEFLPGTGPTRLGPALLKALKRDRCTLLSAVLGPSGDGTPACEKLRSKGGVLRVRMVAMDGETEIELVKSGDRCPGGYVGAATPSPPGAAFLDLTITGTDARTVRFEGYSATAEGALAGCGPEVAGRARLLEHGWKLVGPRQEGCSR
jgi:hypothetical protein